LFYQTRIIVNPEENTHMGLTHVTVRLKGFGTENGTYEADFLVDTGATDCLAPASELARIGVKPVGKMVYELADGALVPLLGELLRCGGGPPAS
jgi:predicted aspartyl protease